MTTMQTTDAGPATMISEPEAIEPVEAGGAESGATHVAQIAAVVQPPPDPVRLTAVNCDFGDGAFFNGAPVAFGMLNWDLSSGTVHPRLTGTLYLNNSQGREAKMQMRFFDVFDNQLANKSGGSVTPSSNGLHQWSVDLARHRSSYGPRMTVFGW